jgi:hypothetical protein
MRPLASLLLVLSIAGCKSSPPPPSAPPELAPVLAAYEELRAGLAADRSVTQAASKARAAAEQAGSTATKAKPRLDAIARSAGALEQAGADLEAQRLKFGDVSRELIGLAQLEPALQQDRFVYECPMARGYRKWVQSTPQIDNPYMGKSMLQCGAESTWAP